MIDLYSSMNKRPTVLLLGQKYLALETGRDPLLAEIKRKLDLGIGEGEATYDVLLDSSLSLNWVWERCKRFSVPEWLKKVAEFPWSSIYTSSIDTIISLAFQANWRELQPVLEAKYKPSNPRSRQYLHMTHLFGRTDLSDNEYQSPPNTRREYRVRRQTAVELVQRLPELITPLGYFFIEGYDPSSDWLPLDELLPIIDKLQPGQVHIFSSKYWNNHITELNEYIDEGLVALHEERLNQFLVNGEKYGLLLGSTPDEIPDARHVELESTVLQIPTDLWNTVSRSAFILDDQKVSEPLSISQDRLYSEFRNWLSTSVPHPIWSGYSSQRNFNFVREYEHELYERVKNKLQTRELLEAPVVLHGQTGTGKTIALGYLAYRIRQERKYPVLFISRKSHDPSWSDIDVFCKHAEDNGAPSTLVVWDGMRDIESYFRLYRELRGRGRKVLIAGSTYPIPPEILDSATSRDDFIAAPGEFSKEEKDRFFSFLERFEDTLGSQIKSVNDRFSGSDEPFLVSLFRLLPPTRKQIRDGISMEFQNAQRIINERVQRKINTRQVPVHSALAYALLEKNLITVDNILSTEKESFIGESLDQVSQLMACIAVPSKFGLEVPLELVLRALGKTSHIDFVEILGQDSVFRWSEDNNGNIAVSTRHPLEARIYCDLTVASPRREVEIVGKLISEVRERNSISEDNEIQFVVELIRRMGPNSPEHYGSTPYREYYEDLSRYLSALREERSISNPRLMLQEAVLLREYSKGPEEREGRSTQALIERAETVLNLALSLLGDDPSSNKLRFNILVEKATGLGTLASQGYNNNELKAAEYYKLAREQLIEARKINPENYYPIDILGWTTRDYIKSDIPSEIEKAEAKATILDVFATAEQDRFAVEHEMRFQTRRLEIARVLEDTGLEDSAFERLDEIGSAAGYYLRAVGIAGPELTGVKRIDTPLTTQQIHRAKQAHEYLDSNRDAIDSDSRTLNLLLRLWWFSTVHKPMFYSERQALPFDSADWLYCLRIISQMQLVQQSFFSASSLFIRGICEFHLAQYQNAKNTFRELEREADQMSGMRRIARSYLVSEKEGRPKRFTGIVEWVDEIRNRGEVRVNEISERIKFIPSDFSRRDLKQGDILPDFHIAFNYISILADPIGLFQHTGQ